MDATIGHPQMSFLDAFQGYHQIPLALDDQEMTAFVTPIITITSNALWFKECEGYLLEDDDQDV